MKFCIHFGLIDVFFSIYIITLIGLNHVHMYSRLSISYDYVFISCFIRWTTSWT